MKNTFAVPSMMRRGLLAVVAALSLTLAGCEKTTPSPANNAPGANSNAADASSLFPAPSLPPAASPTLVDVAAANADFSTLVAAVVKTNLVGALSTIQPYTVFAPNNAAFAQLPAPFNSAANIAAITDQQQIASLRDILLYHVAEGRRPTATFPLRGPFRLSTLRPAPVGRQFNSSFSTSRNANGFFINGTTRVIATDIKATNGIIHVLDRVLIPPTETIAAVIIANPSLSILVQALQRPAAQQLLTNAGRPTSPAVTLFAPTNAAFEALLRQLNLTSLDQVSDSQLTEILLGHFALGLFGESFFSPDFTNGQVVRTLNGDQRIGVTGSGITVAARNNPTPANVITADVLAINGVVHVIDRVLLP